MSKPIIRRCAGMILSALFLCGTGPLWAVIQSSESVGVPGAKIALIPMPREVHIAGRLDLDQGIRIRSSKNAEDEFTANDLAEDFRARGVESEVHGRGKITVELLRSDTSKAITTLKKEHLSFTPEMHDEGYVLVADRNTVYDIGATAAGVFYGAQTLKELIDKDGTVIYLQTGTIRDWPAMKYRGLDDDLSRGPLPTLEYQKKQIRTLAAFKVNIYSPYYENTLQYTSNPLPAPPGGAMTRADVKALVQYALKYHITIIPEQEAFGHLHHTLIYETYNDLAETPHGNVLAPGNPGSLKLIDQWFTEIAEMFPGPFMHVGADETFDLGAGKTKQAVAQQGLAKVYIDFVRQIYTALQPLHKHLLFWGDIAMKSPELVKTLPKDLIAVAWTYDPEADGYDRWLKPYTDAGMETWVAPGVNNWSRVYPDNNRALPNIQGFVADGQRLGSTGELNTVWNDDGEGLFAEDWYGVLFGAAAGWQPGLSSIPQFQQSYGQVFHGDTTEAINQAQRELMVGHRILTKAGFADASDGLFWEDPWSKQGQNASAKLLPVVHDLRIHAENALVLIERARMQEPLRETDALDAMELGARRMDFIGQKFQQAQAMLDEYRTAYAEQNDPGRHDDVLRLMSDIYSGSGECMDMRDGYGLIRDMYRKAWLKENRPYWLDNILIQYDMSMEMWIRRASLFHAAKFQFDDGGGLPSLQQLGFSH